MSDGDHDGAGGYNGDDNNDSDHDGCYNGDDGDNDYNVNDNGGNYDTDDKHRQPFSKTSMLRVQPRCILMSRLADR